MPLKQRVYTLDEMPDWLAEACSAIPIVDFDDPSIDALPTEERKRLRKSQRIEVPAPLPIEMPLNALRKYTPYSNWCRMHSHKITYEVAGEFHSSPWASEAEAICASDEGAEFIVEKTGLGKGADIAEVADGGLMLFSEKAREVCEEAGFKDLHFRKINARYPDGVPANLKVYSAQILSVTDGLDLERSSLSWRRQRDGSGFACSGGSGKREIFKSSELTGVSFFSDVSMPKQAIVTKGFLDVLASGSLDSKLEIV